MYIPVHVRRSRRRSCLNVLEFGYVKYLSQVKVLFMNFNVLQIDHNCLHFLKYNCHKMCNYVHDSTDAFLVTNCKVRVK